MQTPCRPGHARIAVGHVAGALLVRDRNEADAGERKQVERIHVRRADDAEDVGHAVRDQRFDERLGRRHLLASLNGEIPGFGHRVHGVIISVANSEL